MFGSVVAEHLFDMAIKEGSRPNSRSHQSREGMASRGSLPSERAAREVKGAHFIHSVHHHFNIIHTSGAGHKSRREVRKPRSDPSKPRAEEQASN